MMQEPVFFQLKNFLIAGNAIFFRSTIDLVKDKNELITVFEDVLNNAPLNKKNELWGNIYNYLTRNFVSKNQNPFCFLIDYIIAYDKYKEFADSFRFFCKSLQNHSYSHINPDFSYLFIEGHATHQKFLREEVLPELKKQNHVMVNILLYLSLNQIDDGKLIIKEWPEIAEDDFLFRDRTGLNIRFSTLCIVENLFLFSENHALLLDKQSAFMELHKDLLSKDHKIYFYVYNFLAEHCNENKNSERRFCHIPFGYLENTFDETDNITLDTYHNLFSAKNIDGKFQDYLNRLKIQTDKEIINEIIVSISKKKNQVRL